MSALMAGRRGPLPQQGLVDPMELQALQQTNHALREELQRLGEAEKENDRLRKRVSALEGAEEERSRLTEELRQNREEGARKVKEERDKSEERMAPLFEDNERLRVDLQKIKGADERLKRAQAELSALSETLLDKTEKVRALEEANEAMRRRMEQEPNSRSAQLTKALDELQARCLQLEEANRKLRAEMDPLRHREDDMKKQVQLLLEERSELEAALVEKEKLITESRSKLQHSGQADKANSQLTDALAHMKQQSAHDHDVLKQVQQRVSELQTENGVLKDKLVLKEKADSEAHALRQELNALRKAQAQGDPTLQAQVVQLERELAQVTQQLCNEQELHALTGREKAQLETQLAQIKTDLTAKSEALQMEGERVRGADMRQQRLQDELRRLDEAEERARRAELELHRCQARLVELQERERQLSEAEERARRTHREREAALQMQLDEAAERCRRLTSENAELRKKADDVAKMTDECNSLRNTLAAMTSECTSRRTEADALQTKLSALEMLVQQLKDVADKKKANDVDQQAVLAELERKKDDLVRLQQVHATSQREHQDAVELLQNKLRDLERKTEMQNIKHEELMLELESARARHRPRVDMATASRSSNDLARSADLQDEVDALWRGRRSDMDPAGSKIDGVQGCRLGSASGPRLILCESRCPYEAAGMPLKVGDLVLVRGEASQEGLVEAELPDGRRGVIPAPLLTRVPDTRLGDALARLLQQGRPPPPPMRLRLEKDGVLAWDPPTDMSLVAGYQVMLDGKSRATVAPNPAPQFLIEPESQARVASVRSVSPSGVLSAELSLVLRPGQLSVSQVTAHSALLQWTPADASVAHVILVDGVEQRTVRPGLSRCRLTGLSADAVHRVCVRAQGQQDGSEVTFRTLAEAPLEPPLDVRVSVGPSAGQILVSWLPCSLHCGGYVVLVDGQKVAELLAAGDDHAILSTSHPGLAVPGLHHITVRTLSADRRLYSADSARVAVPAALLGDQMPDLLGGKGHDDEPRDHLSDILEEPELEDEFQDRPRKPAVPAISITSPSPKGPRVFVALFDYDPKTMSPNVESAHEELPFREGQLIKVYGEPDEDGFYAGESGGRRGLLPCNMVSEVQCDDPEVANQLLREAEMPPRPARRMIAMYDYDPRQLSPNPDSDAELAFRTGDLLLIYGDMDEDGFFDGQRERDGARGLVPSNFLRPLHDEEGRRSKHEPRTRRT